VEQLAGLSQSNPRMAAAIAVFMFSLTGLPPLAGFWGKFGLLFGALGVDAQAERITAGLWPWFLALTIVAVVNAAISAGYYLRIVATMYFRPALAQPAADGGVGAAFATFLCAVLVVYMGVDPGPWQTAANRVSRSSQSTYRTVVAQTPMRLHDSEQPADEDEHLDDEEGVAVVRIAK
jgi:NADH-quinone oxidoreductase subunit N